MSITVNDLIKAYTTDRVSPYRKLRHRTRINYECMLRRVDADYGTFRVADIKYRTLLEWHAVWSDDGAHIPMAHGLVGMLRTLIGFGVTFMEDDHCARVAGVLSKTRFEMGPPRTQAITAEQVVAIRARAHRNGLPMIALAQAIQFDGTFRQKDVIGEWCPLSEPGVSEVVRNDVHELYQQKWLRGLRWNEIDDNLILSHVTSKKLKRVQIDLKLGPMIMEEFGLAFCDLGEPVTRTKLPASGPVIVDPDIGLPFLPHKFRRQWRTLARECGFPDELQNRDSRAGAITEAIGYGVSIEDAGKAATHSTTQITSIYNRGDAQAVARSMIKRAAGRARASDQDEVA